MNTQNYERLVHDHEEERLAYYTEKANNQSSDERDKELLLNMSIREILGKISVTFIDIINDLSSGEIKGVRDFLKIIFKKDRMIWIGIIILLVSFGIYIVDITS